MLGVTCLAVVLLAPGDLYSGPFGDSDNPYDAPIPGFVGPAGDGVVDATNWINPIFVDWASRVVDYSPAPGVGTNWRDPSRALGPVTGDFANVVSLGDLYNPANPPGSIDPNNPPPGFGFAGIHPPGSITLGFDTRIRNGPGADFAIFENGFISQFDGRLFAELAFVEVSSDGIFFARFPSISLTSNPVGPFGTVDVTRVYNLAGKHANGNGLSWGTPFDLEDLADEPLVLSGLVDLNDIGYVRIVDIPGLGFFLDSLGNPIFDAWVTVDSSGFDLEAIGVIHAVPEPSSVFLLVLSVGMLAGCRAGRNFLSEKNYLSNKSLF